MMITIIEDTILTLTGIGTISPIGMMIDHGMAVTITGNFRVQTLWC
jgi:hypothetical protein